MFSFCFRNLSFAALHPAGPAFGISQDATSTNSSMRQVLEFHAERRLSLPIADLGAQVGDLPKCGIEGILIGCLQLRAIKCVEIVNPQGGCTRSPMRKLLIASKFSILKGGVRKAE